MTVRNRNELWGLALMDELARGGVRHIIVAPGSRSTPVVLAAAGDDRFRLHVQIDERSAGFLALGVGKASGVPAAVVTTSGTAVANLMPAVVEASLAEVPLLLLTADRPGHLRGTDANQTIDQVEIFGSYTRLFRELFPCGVSEERLRNLRSVACRAIGAATGDPAGPVHLNLPFGKPLEPSPDPARLEPALAKLRTAGSAGRPDGAPWTRIHPQRPGAGEEQVARAATLLRTSRRPLLVAGLVSRPWEVGPVLRRTASTLGIPLLADTLSGARFPSAGGEPSPAPVVVGGYDLVLREERVRGALHPDLIVRVGAAPTSSVLVEWLSGMTDIPHLLVDAGGRWKDHASCATELIQADPVRFLEALSAERAAPTSLDPDWPLAWTRAETVVRGQIEGFGVEPLFEGAVASDTVLQLAEEELLFVSSSMAVRDLDTFVPSRHTPLPVLGNRGASGIDGIVSTAAGASLATGRRVVLLMGDLALLHDANGLSILREGAARVLLVVVNNDGGGIFHLLPIREYEPAFTPLFATPHGRDLSHLAAFHELPHRRVECRIAPGEPAGRSRVREELRNALQEALAREGSGILEIRTDRDENRRGRSEQVEVISTAVADALNRDDG